MQLQMMAIHQKIVSLELYILNLKKLTRGRSFFQRVSGSPACLPDKHNYLKRAVNSFLMWHIQTHNVCINPVKNIFSINDCTFILW